MIKKLKNWITSLDRPWQLIGIISLTFITIAVINGITNAGLYHYLFYPELETTPQVQAWSARVYAAIFILSLPVAFLIWYWRDRNVRDQIENARKDTNLKEFNDIQLRLAGAIDDNVSEKSKIALQNAALFQMSSFLAGDRGHEFIRTAFEAIRAKFDSDFEEAYTKKFKRNTQNIEKIYRKCLEKISSSQKINNLLFKITIIFRHELRFIKEEYRKNPYTRMNHQFFYENYDLLYQNNFFKNINISLFTIKKNLYKKNLIGIKAIGATFFDNEIFDVNFEDANLLGAYFHNSSIENCNFFVAKLDSSKFYNAEIVNCDFSAAMLRGLQLNYIDSLTQKVRYSKFVNCKFIGADLAATNFGEQDFTNADFSNANLINSNFGKCVVDGADFTNCDMRGAYMTRINPQDLKSCKGAIFDNRTSFHPSGPEGGSGWTHEQLNEIRDLWRSCGARHIDDPP